MEKTDELEYHSEVVRDYLEQIPSKFHQWSNYIICGIVLVLFLVSCLIKYPTIVNADFKLLSAIAPKPVIARINGRLEQLFVVDNQYIKKGQPIGYLESTGQHDQVLSLETELVALTAIIKKQDLSLLRTRHLYTYQNLGEIQTNYQDFQQVYVQTLATFANGYYEQKLNLLKNDIVELHSIIQNLDNQKQIQTQDLIVQDTEYQRNKKLYDNNVIANSEFLKEKSKLLAKQLPLKNTKILRLNNLLLINEKENEILNLNKLALEQKEEFIQSLYTLRSAIAKWKSIYILTAPISGKINFVNMLQEKQNLKTNTTVLYVSSQKENYQGELKIPQDNFGKVKVGQKVLIKFQGYPFQEYGAAEGVIKSIAQLPNGEKGTFYAVVALPNRQKTTNNKIITFRNGMTASAEIITEDMKLVEQIFYSFKKILN